MTKPESNGSAGPPAVHFQEISDDVQLNVTILSELLRATLMESFALSAPADAVIRAALRYLGDIQQLLGE